jgi:uncharacterized glyoxalase superfamily protein PhnB
MTDGPVFNQFNLVVSDMAAAVRFYRRLGLEIPETGRDWEAHHRTAETSAEIGTVLDFDSTEAARTWDEGWPREHRMGVLGFRVRTREAVDDIYRDLTDAGYEGEQPPYDTFWGSRYAIVLDPDANPVGIMSPADPEHRTKPPPAP